MNRRARRAAGFLLLANLHCGGALAVAVAPSGDFNYALLWTVDGGGERSSDGAYELLGTLAQMDASAVMTGGDFSVSGGFHHPSAAPDRVFADGFQVP